jgi:O-Antigen ligase
MKRDLLLALGIVLSAASKLRPGGAPVGPGEVCLVIWIFLAFGREAFRRDPKFTPPLSRVLIFWLIFAMALSIGTLVGFAMQDDHDTSTLLHDVFAYPLLAGISLLSVAGMDAGPRLHRVTWCLVIVGSVLLAFQVGQAWDIIDVGIDPWFWNRFRGLSENPNQLAFLCAMLGLLSLHLADVATSTPARIGAIATTVLPIYVGRLTKSDTFAIVLVAAGPIFIAFKLRTWLLSKRPRLTVRSASAWIALLVLPLVLVTVLSIGSSLMVEAREFAGEMAKGDKRDTENTASIRFENWRNAINRGLESAMLGLGPGPHLPIPDAIRTERQDPKSQPKYIGDSNTQVNGTMNFEAHNTPLDIFTQGGLIAVLGLVWLVAAAFLLTCRRRLDGLTTMLCGLIIFSTFHLLVRHPIFWFAIAVCLVAWKGSKAEPSRQRS